MTGLIQRFRGLLPALLHAAIASGLLFAAVPSSAQPRALQAPSGPNTEEQKTQLRTNRGDARAASAKSSIDAADSTLMRRIAETHYAEIQMAALAQEISTDAKVKGFAQTLLDDHYAALSELRKLADIKGVILPGGASTDNAGAATKLARQTGKDFDREFMASAGLEAHQQAVKLLEETGKRAKDEDLQAYASKTLQPVNRHLQLAQQLQGTDQAPAAAK